VESAVERDNSLRQVERDAFLTAHPRASFFHTPAWAAVLQEAYGCRPAEFRVRQGGALKALIPLMEVDSWLTGRRGVCLPFTDACEPLCEDQREFNRLLKAVLVHGQDRDWRYLEVRGGGGLLPASPPSATYFGHVLELEPDLEAVFERLHEPVRRAIRKALKEGVTVEITTDFEALELFYELHCGTRRRLGLPPQPFRFFGCLHRHVLSQKLGFVAVARQAGRPIAAAVFCYFGERAIYKYGASDRRFQHLRPNNLLMWEAIRWFARRGFRSLDLGRTDRSHEGLRRFKLGWGTRELVLEYRRYDVRRGKFVEDGGRNSGIRDLACRLLTMPGLRAVGGAIYGHMG
jgi:lipid II:glycine glycyltransferase (peptidoglycan interpeptide bridge formation enzyme)